MQLRFCDADHGSRAALQQFTCTHDAQYDPGLRKRVHRESWALKAQSLVRDIRLPLPDGEHAVLAYDERDSLVAVGHYRYLKPRDAAEPPVFEVLVLACALSVQRNGVGKELLTRVLEQIRDENPAHAGVTTYIHAANVPSKKLAASLGFEFIDDEDDNYELWGLTTG